jgi:hypothetical protein
LKDKILEIVDRLAKKELPLDARVNEPWERGSVAQDQRMMEIASLCSELEGDFCEIGCMCGGTTSGLARIARTLNKRVIACDPWEVGLPNCSGIEYELFLNNTRKWSDIIDVIRLRSEDPEAIKHMKSRKLCFAYVDGYHDYEHAKTDIESVSHSKIVCVDDLWNNGVRQAFEESPRPKIYNTLCKEAYLV